MSPEKPPEIICATCIYIILDTHILLKKKKLNFHCNLHQNNFFLQTTNGIQEHKLVTFSRNLILFLFCSNMKAYVILYTYNVIFRKKK